MRKLSSKVFFFPKSLSTSRADFAPRLKASKATTPDPENKSKKVKPLRSPRMENIDSLILSMAGRMTPGGQATMRPRRRPPVILMTIPPG
jgi:hypothetical protein